MGVTDPGFARWQPGFGAIRHRRETQGRVRALVASLGRDDAWPLFHAADRLASAGAWLVVHQTYALNVHLDRPRRRGAPCPMRARIARTGRPRAR
jgi:hypothetical protein